MQTGAVPWERGGPGRRGGGCVCGNGASLGMAAPKDGGERTTAASPKEPKRPHFTRRFATLRIDFEGCFPAAVWPPGVLIHLTLAASRLPAKPSPPSPPPASGSSIRTEMGGQLGQEAGSRKHPDPLHIPPWVWTAAPHPASTS